jgi:hypothetical protein
LRRLSSSRDMMSAILAYPTSFLISACRPLPIAVEIDKATRGDADRNFRHESNFRLLHAASYLKASADSMIVQPGREFSPDSYV